MNIEILAIGDELLIGQTVNTNASWLGQELSKIGARVTRSLVIADDKDRILQALDQCYPETTCVIITGGLGPTKDDITKHTLCEYFDTKLEIHQPTLAKIEAYFTSRNRPMLESNIQQAALPIDAEILSNNYGTAAGMMFEKDGRYCVSLPGVPYEMKGIVLEELIPRLIQRFQLKAMYHYTALTQGIGESFLAEQISDWEDRIRERGFGLAYLPSPGIVKLRITSYEGKEDQAEIMGFFQELAIRLPEAVFGYENDSLPEVIGKLLRNERKTIGSVESCTSGLLAQQITSISGASDYYMGSLLTYSNDLKHRLCGVSVDSLLSEGAVSEKVALEMAENGAKKLGVDVCISTTGIAGPEGGTIDKPVGLVWIGLYISGKTIARKFQFGDNRERNIQMTVLSALNWLRYELSKS
jgi:nicotinamide-nucleotide amidase